MAGGGHVIIKRLAQIEEVGAEDRDELAQIAIRNASGCSLTDAVRVLLILWKYLRA